MTLFIADDNVKFRKQLAELLGSFPGIEVVGGAGDVPRAIEGIRKLKPDAAILDLHMPGGNGLDVLSAVRRMPSPPLVVVLTVATRGEYGARCAAAGADYFFEKSSELQKMTALLRKLAARSAASYSNNTSL